MMVVGKEETLALDLSLLNRELRFKQLTILLLLFGVLLWVFDIEITFSRWMVNTLACSIQSSKHFLKIGKVRSKVE
ncbi:hypothetical protein TSPI_06975 [Trichinella spiralis]|uniref:Uncharacterized protein n=1 Tax=Trichinella spiralis TaxID=6334 RepID=A0ABR3KFC2_TRISP